MTKRDSKKIVFRVKKVGKKYGLSIPTGPVNITHNYNVISD